MNIEQAYDRIYRYAYFRVNDSYLAEDITQEAFLRYIKKQGTGDSYDMPYLYTVAKNLCIDENKRVKLETFEDGDINDLYIQNPYSRVSVGEAEMIDKLMIKEALSKLTEQDRELLLLRYVNEEPVASLAEFYQCSRFAVYRKIKAAVKELKGYLGGVEEWIEN